MRTIFNKIFSIATVISTISSAVDSFDTANEGTVRQPLLSQQPKLHQYFQDCNFDFLVESGGAFCSEQLKDREKHLLEDMKTLEDEIKRYGSAYRQLIFVCEYQGPLFINTLCPQALEAYQILTVLSVYKICVDLMEITKQDYPAPSLLKYTAYTAIARRCRRFSHEPDSFDSEAPEWQAMVRLTGSAYELSVANRIMEKVATYMELYSMQLRGAPLSPELEEWCNRMMPADIPIKLIKAERRLRRALDIFSNLPTSQFPFVQENLRTQIMMALQATRELQTRSATLIEEQSMSAPLETRRI